MPENKLVDLSFGFAKSIVELVDTIKMPKSSYMVDQLARAGTSVGANIHEAQYAHSKADFIAKLEIALKEANETSYWLKLLMEKARQMGGKALAICGNINFYGKSGFVVASTKGVHYYAEPRENEVPYFLIKELEEGFLSGVNEPLGFCDEPHYPSI